MPSMKKSRILQIIPLITAVCFVSIPAQAQYGGGTGEPNDPYLIATAEQMNAIGQHPEHWDKHFQLMADIDLGQYTEETFNIIGVYQRSKDNLIPFTGVFDGNGHVISNFTYEYTETGTRQVEWVTMYYPTFTALFKYAKDAHIKNLGLIDPNVSAPEYMNACVASLVGKIEGGVVSHCYVYGGNVSSNGSAGGLIMWNYPGTSVVDCYATCNVSAGSKAGGLIGGNYKGQISNCYASGDVTGRSDVGGLVGQNQGGAEGAISYCYATGHVSGDWDVGGLVGENRASISNSWASGNVNATGSYVGGLAGKNDGWSSDAVISACFATGNVSGKKYIGGLVGFNGPSQRPDAGCTSTIVNCYATGSVSGEDYLGGLAGSHGVEYLGGVESHLSKCYSIGKVTMTKSYSTNVGGLVGKGNSVDACFWDVETSGQNSSAGGSGAMGKTTVEMQNPNLYLDAGWDFIDETANGKEDIWRVEPNVVSTPRLDWESATEVLLVRFDLDQDPNWVNLGPWQFGEPQGLGGTEHGHPDPNAGYTGSNVYGVNLAGDYDVNEPGPFYLTTDAIDCSEYRHVCLRFSRWLNTDGADYVEAFVDVSNDSTNWHRIWTHTDTESALTDDFWHVVCYDISAIADGEPTVYLSWGYRIIDPEAYAFSGWNIDDIELLGCK